VPMAAHHPPAFRYRARCRAPQEAQRRQPAAIRLVRSQRDLGYSRHRKSRTRLKLGISTERHLIADHSPAQHGRGRLIARYSGLTHFHTVAAPWSSVQGSDSGRCSSLRGVT
jgi:hypothetical protein